MLTCNNSGLLTSDVPAEDVLASRLVPILLASDLALLIAGLDFLSRLQAGCRPAVFGCQMRQIAGLRAK